MFFWMIKLFKYRLEAKSMMLIPYQLLRKIVVFQFFGRDFFVEPLRLRIFGSFNVFLDDQIVLV